MLVDYKWKVSKLVWFSAPLKICQRDGQLIKTTRVAIGQYRIVDEISLGVICIRPANTRVATLRVNKAEITKYDKLAAILAQPAQWLESTGGIQTPEGVEVGEIALEDEELEAEQELQYGTA